jgi:hypothetical protein
VRPFTIAASAALIAALALVAVPPIAGSRTPSRSPAIDAAAFRQILPIATEGGSTPRVGPLDPAYRSAGSLAVDGYYVQPGAPLRQPKRPRVDQPEQQAEMAWKPGRYTMTGYATFYDHGTTAMRLPRGTIIRVCGAGGCLERTVTDYGPSAKGGRIIDLYRPDFFKVCGCPSWSGTTKVTVHVY